jgi:hypothetical protein
MRFHHMAGRIFLTPALALTAAAALAACSSGGSPSATTTAGGTASASVNAADATAQIKANWQEFFASGTANDKRVGLLQNGTAFATAIKTLEANPLASTVSAKVDSVTLTSATKAKVKYDLTAAGQTVAKGQSGTAVYENGTWKVGDDVFCGLLNEGAAMLNIKVPAACSSAG